MDLNRLRIEVFEKTGIKIDTSDPIFALVALNEAVLSECIVPHIEKLEKASEDLQEQTSKLIIAGNRYKALLEQSGKTVDDPSSKILDASTLPGNDLLAPLFPKLIAGGLAIAVLSAILTVIGLSLTRPTSVAPISLVPPVNARSSASPASLTAEQKQLIENGEKYAKFWPKLDGKTQSKIQSLLQQP